MAFEIYGRIELASDKYREDGAKRGDIGYIIEVYPNGDYEVEFSSPDGMTYAQIVATGSELTAAPLSLESSGRRAG